MMKRLPSLLMCLDFGKADYFKGNPKAPAP